MIIRKASQADARAIGELYASLSPNIRIEDEIQVIAEKDGMAIGIIRLDEEEGALVVRGMNVRGDYQRQGIGKQMLTELEKQIGESDCYCLPFPYLEEFYGTIGFEKIGLDQAPQFLAQRLERYISMGMDMIVMRRKGLAY